MIERNKKLFIGLFIYLILTYLIALPFVLIFNRNDIIGIASIVSTLLLLLFINFRSGYNLKGRYKEKYLNKKKSMEKDQKFVESQRILWIAFAIMVIITIIACCIVI